MQILETITAITIVQWTGIVLIAIGFFLKYKIASRQYSRIVNAANRPRPPFFIALLVGIIEWLFRWAAQIAILFGAFLLLIEWYNGHWFW